MRNHWKMKSLIFFHENKMIRGENDKNRKDIQDINKEWPEHSRKSDLRNMMHLVRGVDSLVLHYVCWMKMTMDSL